MKKQFILILGITALLLTACAKEAASSKQMSFSKVRFQSVPAKEAVLQQSGENKTSCAICGMHLPTFYKTNHAADTKTGVKQYCSLHCVVKDNEINKTDLSNLRVVDTNSLKFIPALYAFYVVGSKKPGTMSRVSKYAFSSKKAAEKFALENGGKVMGFYDAYDVAKKDFLSK